MILTPLKGIVTLIYAGEMEVRMETGPRIKFPAKIHINEGDRVQILFNYETNKPVDIIMGWEEYGGSAPPTKRPKQPEHVQTEVFNTVNLPDFNQGPNE